MKDKLFLDTNILIHCLNDVKKINGFIISSITIEELNNIKESKNKTEEQRRKAIKASNWLDENDDKYEVVLYDLDIEEELQSHKLVPINDIKICCCAKYIQAKYPNIVFVSNDTLCRLFAKNCFNLKTDKIGNKEEIYTGYKKILGTSDEINLFMNNINPEDWNINEYLIIENKDDNSCKEMRFDGEKFVTLKLPSSKFIKGKNSLQRCALDALSNPNITICAVLGTYGSGKTYLSMQMALYNIQEKGYQSKILGVREATGEGAAIGFLPGDMEDKVGKFFAPLVHSLKGKEFELERLKQDGTLEVNVPYYMKGTTYNQTCIIVDEAEDLNESQIKLVGTRLGENSRIFFAGDYKQSLVNKTQDNALIKMCNEFKGNPNFACICFEEDVRSEASKMFAELFTD